MSTPMACIPCSDRKTFAVLAPTPESWINLLKSFGIFPLYFSSNCFEQLIMFFVLFL